MPKYGEGSPNAKIMVVGECYGYEDVRACKPFPGPAGEDFSRILGEAGLMRSQCYITNLYNSRPPGGRIESLMAMTIKARTTRHVQLHGRYVEPELMAGYRRLLQEIAMVKPNLIITCGTLPLWALTGAYGVTKWRGSCLRQTHDTQEALAPKVIPTFAMWQITSQWKNRAVMVKDMRVALRESASREYLHEPKWNFIIRPGFAQAKRCLYELTQAAEQLPAGQELWLELDLETRAGHIACLGLSWSTTEAICIPFMCTESMYGYWPLDQEAELVWDLRTLLKHSRVAIRWQNGLYDAQYIWRHWHFIPRGRQDTMISMHTAFVALPKSLAYQSSIFSEHYVYWKDDGKTWNPSLSEEQLWEYNCVDCVRTREVGEAELAVIKDLGMQEVEDFQQKLFWPVLRAMQLGLRVDTQRRASLERDILEEISIRENFLADVLGFTVNIKSPKQMLELFYGVLRQPVVYSKAKPGQPAHPTCDDEALQAIVKREPLLRPIVRAISDLRTLGVFLSTFIRARLDTDGRMRCSYNIAGTSSGKSAPYTYRLSSSQDAFGSGVNLQTIPSEKSKSSGKAKSRGMTFVLPNMRGMYVPDPGYTFFDMDLDRADLQVVVWESDDPLLKTALRMGVDMHLLNVFALDGKEPPPLEELVQTHPKYPDHLGPNKHKREFAKVFCHATNYLGKARTVAAHTGRIVHEIERTQAAYFGRYPGIRHWQERTIAQVTKHHFIENKFGYRWHIFDRVNDLVMPAAVAWIPQSTVGIYINKIWAALYEQAPEIQVLLQVHDSLAGQFPTHLDAACRAKIASASKIIVPYDDPLIIPTGLNTSTISWGDCA